MSPKYGLAVLLVSVTAHVEFFMSLLTTVQASEYKLDFLVAAILPFIFLCLLWPFCSAAYCHRRKRHVKCDEARPSCQRCMKWQGFCDGYESTSTPNSENGKGTSTSGSSPDTNTTSTSTELVKAAAPMAPTAVATPVLLEPNFNGGVFDYQWEKVYFDHWLALANNMGGGFFKSDLWTRTIPQLSRDEPAIRYAGMAIGAMANAMAPMAIPAYRIAEIGRAHV